MKNKNEKANVKYDYETDIFYALPVDREYNSSYQIGNLIFDLNRNNEIRGIEIINASKIFNIPKRYLRSSISGQLTLEVDDEAIKMKLVITSKIRNSEKSSTFSVERLRPDFVSPSAMQLAVA